MAKPDLKRGDEDIMCLIGHAHTVWNGEKYVPADDGVSAQLIRSVKMAFGDWPKIGVVSEIKFPNLTKTRVSVRNFVRSGDGHEGKDGLECVDFMVREQV